MEVPNVLIENLFLDWKKKEISKEERSDILKSYLKERNISERELSRELNINYSTLHDWISNRQSTCNRVKMIFNKKDMIYSLANRLIFLLSKENNIDDKTMKELKNLTTLLNDKI